MLTKDATDLAGRPAKRMQAAVGQQAVSDCHACPPCFRDLKFSLQTPNTSRLQPMISRFKIVIFSHISAGHKGLLSGVERRSK